MQLRKEIWVAKEAFSHLCAYPDLGERGLFPGVRLLLYVPAASSSKWQARINQA